MKRKISLLLTVGIVLGLLLAACAKPTPETIVKKVEVTRIVQGTPITEIKEVKVTRVVKVTPVPTKVVTEFHIAWPYTPPPQGHFNTFVSDRINLSIYHPLMEPPLFGYIWHDQSWMPLAGKEWKWLDDKTIQVKLQVGKWSDGSEFTSKDVIDTFDILRLQDTSVWKQNILTSVKAVDDHTVNFVLANPSTIAPRRILRLVPIRASSVYGKWAQKTRDLIAKGLTPNDSEWKALNEEFNKFRPDDMVVLGPYKIDKNSITESQMILNKYKGSFMADWVKFDRLVNYNGETPDITPLVLARKIDYATHGFPPATEAQFVADGTRIIRAPLYSGPALYFNMDVHPFELVKFRQAVAYVIDRNENGVISLGKSGKRTKYVVGFSDNLVPNWLTKDTVSKLNQYEHNTAKAEEILKSLGFKRGSDGVWLDDKGKRMEFELTAPAEYADWSAAGENAAEQLTKFGIKTTFRGINYQQHPVDVRAGNFQLAIRNWGAANPHPYFSYDTDLNSYNATGGEQAATAGKGMDFPLVQKTSMGKVDLDALLKKSGQGKDLAAQKAVVNKLALAYNELLPQIPLWERYGNNPAPQVRVAGWPPDGDPIYENGPYGDPFVTVLLLKGKLHPAPSK